MGDPTQLTRIFIRVLGKLQNFDLQAVRDFYAYFDIQLERRINSGT